MSARLPLATGPPRVTFPTAGPSRAPTAGRDPVSSHGPGAPLPPVKVKNPTLTDLVLATRTRPTFFAFTPNANQSVLVMSKTRLTTRQLAGLPKGLPVFRGVCQWEDGKLVFNLGVEPPKTLSGQLKATVKRETALDHVVLTRFSKELVGDVPAEEPGPGATEGEKPPGERREDERALQERALQLRELATRVKVATERLPQGEARTSATEELTRLAREGRTAIQDEEISAIDDTIERMKGLLERLPPAPERSPGDQDGGRKAREKLGELSDSVKKALEGRNKTRVASLVEKVRAAIGREDWDAAGPLLDALEDEVRFASSEPTEEWVKRIDLERYQKGRIVGKGGRGTAYFLDSPDPGRPLLVAKHQNNGERDELDKEVLNYGLVGDHPNFVRCAGILELPEGTALVLERVRGRETKDIVKELRQAAQPGKISVGRSGGLDREEAGALSHEEFIGATQHLIQQMLQAAAHLEEKGLVHGDLKPENVMVDETTGDVKVIDLGGLEPVGVTRSQITPRWAPGGDLSEGTSFDVGTIGKIAKQLVTEDRQQKPMDTELKKFVAWLTDKTPGKRPSAKEALAHPFLRDRLLDAEQARRVLKGMVRRHQDRPPEPKDDELGAFPVTQGLTIEAFDASIEAARQKGYAPEPTLVAEVQTLLRARATLPDPWELVRAGKDPTADLERAKKVLDAVETRLAKLRLQSNGALARYFDDLHVAVVGLLGDAGLRKGRHEATTSGFVAKWADVRTTLEETLAAAREALGEGGDLKPLDVRLSALAEAEDDLREAEGELADAKRDGETESGLEDLVRTVNKRRKKVVRAQEAVEDARQHYERHGLGENVTIDAFFALPKNLLQAFTDIDQGISQRKRKVMSGVQRGDPLADGKRAAAAGLGAALKAVEAWRHHFSTAPSANPSEMGGFLEAFSVRHWRAPLRTAEQRLQDLLRSVNAL